MKNIILALLIIIPLSLLLHTAPTSAGNNSNNSTNATASAVVGGDDNFALGLPSAPPAVGPGEAQRICDRGDSDYCDWARHSAKTPLLCRRIFGKRFGLVDIVGAVGWCR